MGRKPDRFPNLPTLSPTEEIILRTLITAGEQYGLQLVKTSGGTLKHGTVYVLLDRMEQKGYIESRRDETSSPEASMPRRLYKPTRLGGRVYQAWSAARAVMAGKLVKTAAEIEGMQAPSAVPLPHASEFSRADLLEVLDECEGYVQRYAETTRHKHRCAARGLLARLAKLRKETRHA